MSATKKPRRPRPASLSISIAYPTSNSEVPQYFIAHGTTEDAGNVTGTLYQGETSYLGKTLKNGPKWRVQFEEIPVGVYDRLEVSTSSSSQSVHNITVVAG